MVLLLTFLGFIVLRVVLLGVGGALLIRSVRSCPACFQPTTPVRVPLLERLTPLEWRWCLHCGWRGPSRRRPRPMTPHRQAGQAS